MKRQISILACLVMIVAVLCAIVSCKAEEPHTKHEWEVVNTVDATCTTYGNISYKCTGCTAVTSESIAKKDHELVEIPAVAATCKSTGLTAGEKCKNCDLVTKHQTITSMLNHVQGMGEVSNDTCVPATVCTNEGCDHVFTAEKKHVIVHVEAKKATCTLNGNIEYWYCSGCNMVWQDEARTQLTNFKNVVVPATGHSYFYECDKVCQNCYALANPSADHTIVHVEAKEKTCFENGNVEHWYCSDCNSAWLDKALTKQTNLRSVVVPMSHAEAVHVAAKDPTCTENGNIEYWYCPDCGYAWLDATCTRNTNLRAVVLPMGHTGVTHVAAKEADCSFDGNVEYWYCKDCKAAYWLDKEQTQTTTAEGVVVKSTGNHGYTYACDKACSGCRQITRPEATHNLVHIEAVAPGCHYTGNIEYWYCTHCECVWSDEALTQVTNRLSVIVPEKGGDVVHFDAIEPACHYEGNIEYWVCYECEQVWADEARTQLTNIKNVILPATGAVVTHFDAVEPGCHDNGNIEYWVCYTCEQVWQNEALTQLTNIKNVILPATGEGNLVHMEKVEAGCHYNGHEEYWVCHTCEKVWADEALTQLTNIKNVVIPETGEGNLVHMNEVEPGCHYEGHIEYWVCYTCEQVWADEARTQLTNIKNVVIPEIGGDVIHVEAKAPTCTELGNIEYWYCEECMQVWQNEARTQLTNMMSVKIGTISHTYVSVVTPPTCTVDGYTTYTCGCGDTYTDDEVEATGHADENGDFKCDGCSEKMLPAADSTLTIKQAIAIGQLYASDSYTTDKYWVEGEITEVYDDYYGNMYIKDAEGTVLLIYGSRGPDNTYYNKLAQKHVAGDIVKVYAIIGQYNGTSQMKNGCVTIVTHEHAYSDATCVKLSTCPCGATTGEYGDHNIVDGKCSNCPYEEGGAEVETNKYTFSDYPAGTQYAENEEHVLDENTTIVTTKCHFTTQLRIYSSSTYNGYAIIKSVNPIKTIAVNAGNKVDTLVIYGSNDNGATWTEVAKINVTSTSYNDYSVAFTSGEYKWLKLDVSGANQVRLQSMTLTTLVGGSDNGGSEPACEHANTTETTTATCKAAGTTTVTCDDCGETVSTEATAALGHTTQSGTCERCNETIGGTTVAEKMPTTKYSFSSYSAGTQYAEGEEHQLDENTKLTINGAHLNTQIRLYAGSNCVFNFDKTVEQIAVTAGNKAGTLTVYVSDDGATWTKVEAITTTTSYTAYTVDLGGSYHYVKLESTGAQIRVSILTVNP